MKGIVIFFKKHKILIGSIWGVLTTCLSIYLTVWPIEQNPELTIYQKQKFDVFALDNPINELQILLNGRDIRKDSFNLKVYKFKFINEGKRDIRNTDYSAEVPFKIKVSGGKIVRANANNSKPIQLDSNVIAGLGNDSTTITLNKIFIGKKDYFHVDIWVLHKFNTDPSIIVSGKIADTKISYSNEDEAKEIDWIGLLKVLLILFGAGFAFIIIGSFFNSLAIRYKSSVIKNIYDQHYDEANINKRQIVKIYSLLGKRRFNKILLILKNSEKTNALYQEELANKNTVNQFYILAKAKKIDSQDKISMGNYKSDLLFVLDMLFNAGLADIQNNLIVLKKEFLLELEVIDRLILQSRKNSDN
jgi:hypothetical protein